jgi:peptide/nickel transport system permease protein
MYWRYVVRRIVFVLPVLLGVTLLVFGLIHLAPGDPVVVIMGADYSPQAADRLREELGLNEPLWSQYGIWLSRVVRGDMGRSLFQNVPVGSLIASRMPLTVQLALASMVIAILAGLPLGILAATRPNTPWDNLGRLAAMIGVSMPVYWWGLILLVVFAVSLRWFPAGGSPAEYGFQALVLPALALGTSFAALIARTTRSSLLEVLSQDYVRTARAKGLGERSVVALHALKNALIPIVTVVGLQFGTVLGGAVLTETIFTLPGVGRLMIDSIARRDYPVIQGCVLVIALGFVLVNLFTDLLYGYLDPRIRLG